MQARAHPSRAALARHVTHLGMGIEEFGGKIRERVVVQGELALEGTIRDALALPESRDDLIQNGIVHATSLPLAVTCAPEHPYPSRSDRGGPERNVRMKCRMSWMMRRLLGVMFRGEARCASQRPGVGQTWSVGRVYTPSLVEAQSEQYVFPPSGHPGYGPVFPTMEVLEAQV